MAVELWMVQAIIREFKLDAVTRALEQVPGFGGMTVSNCRGFGHEKLGTENEDRDNPGARRPEDDLSEFKPRVRLEIAVIGRERADAVAGTIAESAHTGRGGDGKIFLWPLSRAVRIRNFGEDELAL
ncbi:MAG TPA: P-II family nitrogen regulator [Polyangiaceae bacterium]|nr:P-II family nitrogen regulator [Polyangiaceae bacterium]